MRLLKTYLRFISVLISSELEYKYSFIAKQIANMFWCSVTFIGIWIIIGKFKSINGWDAGQLMFIYSMNILSHSIGGMFFWQPMLSLEEKVRTGQFDLLLIKPVSPLTSLVLSNFVYTYIGWIVVSVYILIRSIQWTGIVLNAANLIFILLTIFGAVLINIAIIMITGSLCFWIIKSGDILGLFHNSNRGIKPVVDYPITIYPKVIQFIISFIVPYAFISFYPSAHLFNKGGDLVFGANLQYLSPVVGLIMIFISWIIWKCGIGRYESTGS